MCSPQDFWTKGPDMWDDIVRELSAEDEHSS